ncbi:hypothetical protein L1887_51473 [Cichorium endivia]|nr:hypothetical protein L1887_51473 [Cichorium endivia]
MMLLPSIHISVSAARPSYFHLQRPYLDLKRGASGWKHSTRRHGSTFHLLLANRARCAAVIGHGSGTILPAILRRQCGRIDVWSTGTRATAGKYGVLRALNKAPCQV